MIDRAGIYTFVDTARCRDVPSMELNVMKQLTSAWHGQLEAGTSAELRDRMARTFSLTGCLKTMKGTTYEK